MHFKFQGCVSAPSVLRNGRCTEDTVQLPCVPYPRRKNLLLTKYGKFVALSYVRTPGIVTSSVTICVIVWISTFKQEEFLGRIYDSVFLKCSRPRREKEASPLCKLKLFLVVCAYPFAPVGMHCLENVKYNLKGLRMRYSYPSQRYAHNL